MKNKQLLVLLVVITIITFGMVILSIKLLSEGFAPILSDAELQTNITELSNILTPLKLNEREFNLSEINLLADKYNLKVINIKAINDGEKVEFSLMGKYENICKFLDEIEHIYTEYTLDYMKVDNLDNTLLTTLQLKRQAQ